VGLGGSACAHLDQIIGPTTQVQVFVLPCCCRSNNNVSDWKEFERLKELPNLKDLLLVNTPLYNSVAGDGDDTEWRMEVLKRLPTLTKLDGKDVTDDELETAMAG
jgi:hypothetical protein